MSQNYGRVASRWRHEPSENVWRGKSVGRFVYNIPFSF